MKKTDITLWTPRLMVAIGLLLSISAIMWLWFLLPGTQLILIPYSYVGWGFFFAAVGFAFFVENQLAQVVISVRPFTKILNF